MTQELLTVCTMLDTKLDLFGRDPAFSTKGNRKPRRISASGPKDDERPCVDFEQRVAMRGNLPQSLVTLGEGVRRLAKNC